MEKAPDYFRWWAALIRDQNAGQPAEQRVRALAPLVPVIAGLGSESQVQSACAAVESEMGLDNRDFLALVNEARKKGVRKNGGGNGKPQGDPGLRPRQGSGRGFRPAGSGIYRAVERGKRGVYPLGEG